MRSVLTLNGGSVGRYYFLLAILMLVPLTQAESETPVETDATKTLERVEVTGSHIRRLEAEGASPVETISRKDLEKSAYNSVSDVLRDITANSFGSAREASGSNAAGNAEVDLRGLGASNTLVLLNGQRLPSDAVTGAVDLNLVPMAAVERIEILKDGASAIYGSDALGGVVNIITRKDFSGTEVRLSSSYPELKGGAKNEVSLVNGFNHDKWSVVNVISYRDNKSVYDKNRQWTDNGVSNTGSPGSYRNSGDVWHVDPNCPADRIKRTPNGDLCTFKYSDYATRLPALQQLGLLSEANYEYSSAVKLIGRISATQKKAQWTYAASPGSFVIPGAVADHLGSGGGQLPGTTAGKNLNVSYRLTELGTRDSQVVTNASNIMLGSNIQLGNSWQLDASVAQNLVNTSNRGVNGYALRNVLIQDITTGAFNPFGDGASRGDLSNAKYIPSENTMSFLTTGEVKASGEMIQMESGPLGVAFGTTHTFQKYEDNYDEESLNDNVIGNAGSSGRGSRNTAAIFTEFSIPVASNLEFQLAGRYDKYSDFGSTTNPKAAFIYRPIPTLVVRGSVGTGFKAPLLTDLYAAKSEGNPTFIDAVACKAEQALGGSTPSCEPTQYTVTSNGNPGLKEEKSLSYNIGTVFEPSQDFNIGADVFLTKTKNVVGLDLDEAMKAEAAGTNLAQYGIIVDRDSNGYLQSIEAPLLNLSAQEIYGIDFSTSYRIGKIKVSTDHSQLIYFKEEGFPGAGLTNKLGKNGKPPWKNATSLAYSFHPNQELSLLATTTAAHDKSVDDTGKLPVYTNYDIQYSHKLGLKQAFAVGIRNVLGSTPPLDHYNPNGKLDPSIYDQIGRQIFASYKAGF
jgi:iron complex outermembrane receptor protein